MSATPTTLQSSAAPVEIQLAPIREPLAFMYHTMIWPSVFWKRMSRLPSLLMSATPTTLQSPAAPVEIQLAPIWEPLAFTYHTMIWPSVFWKKRSATPPLLMSLEENLTVPEESMSGAAGTGSGAIAASTAMTGLRGNFA